MIVYYSTSSKNTLRFVQRVGLPYQPLGCIREAFILVTPTYNGKVPAPVVEFLNNATNRSYMRGVIAGGSTNFGHEFARAGHAISKKCNVPLLSVFELTGTEEDAYLARTQILQTLGFNTHGEYEQLLRA